MSRLGDLEAFVLIAETGSLTEAAHRLERSLQAVSRSLASLETDVGVQLVHRTTRQSALSEAGEAFYHRVKPAVEEIKEARLEVVQRRSEPSGNLRVSAPTLFGPKFLMPIIAEYMDSYPNVAVDLQLTDNFVDLSSEGLDLVVRIADLPDSGLQSKKLGALRRVVFGAPSYFERHGRPAHPAELRRHACIIRTVDAVPGQWAFQIDGRKRMVGVRGPFRSNTMDAIYSAVSAGLGLGYSPLWQIRHLVEGGQVEVILKEFEPPPVRIHALWQERKLSPAKVRAFVNLLAKRLKLDDL
jgi:DNA-binding transcriptional LysR family regulator